jgi:hypothetical protein
VTLSEKMFGIFKIGAVDCLEDEELCEEFMVFETPTIKIFTFPCKFRMQYQISLYFEFQYLWAFISLIAACWQI